MNNLFAYADKFTTPEHIDAISDQEFIIKFQQALIDTGWLKGQADGIVGKQTRAAWSNFKNAHFLSHNDIIGKGSLLLLAGDLNDILGENHPVPNDKKLWIEPDDYWILLPSKKRVFAKTQIIQGVPLTWGEMTKDLTRKPRENHIEANIIETAKVFALIREKVKIPLKIHSGYRPPDINKRVGGVFNSQHVQGLAIDFSSRNLINLLAATRAVISDRGSGGIGLGMRRGFIHFDIGRNRKRVVEFDY